MIQTQVRTYPEGDSDLFTGKKTWCSFDTEMAVDHLERQSTLWNFEFKKNEEHYQYLGVFDIDAEGGLDYETEIKYMLINRKPVKRFKNVLNKLKLIFRQCPMAVFYSGSKGIHVYVVDENLLIKKTDRVTREHYMKEYLGPDIWNEIDHCIYAPGSGIRPYTVPNPKTDTMPVWIDIEHEFNWPDFWFTLHRWISQNKIIDIPLFLTPLPDRRATVSNEYVCTYSSIDMLQNVIEHIKKYQISFNAENRKQRGYLTIFNNQLYCFVCCKTHRKAKCSWLIGEEGARQKCIVQEERYYRLLPDLPACTVIPEEYRSEFKEIRTLPKTQKYIKDEDLNDVIKSTNCRRLFISSGMGTGKTFAVEKIVQEESLCCIGVRTIQVSYFANYFQCKDYQKIDHEKEHLYDEKRVAICINSLLKLVKVDRVPCYEVLILDEIDSLARMLSSHMLDNSKTNLGSIWNLLKVLIQTSGMVYFMDGIPTERVYDFMRKVHVIRHTCVIEHVIRPDHRIYIYSYNIYSFFEKIKKTLVVEKKKVCIITADKQSIDVIKLELKSILEKLKTVCITSESKKQEKQTSHKPNKYWKELDVLMYNSSIGPGVSFDEYHFDQLFVWVRAGCADPVELYQLINRIRHVSNEFVYVYAKPASIKQGNIIQRKSHEFALHDTNTQCKLYNEFNLYKEAYAEHSFSGNLRYEKIGPLLDPEVGYSLAQSGCIRFTLPDKELSSFIYKSKQEQEKYRKLDNYINEFFMLIQKNGGLIIDKTKNITSKQEQQYKKAYAILGKRTKESKMDTHLFMQDELNEENIMNIKKYVDLQDMETQKRFCLLKHVMNQEDGKTCLQDILKLHIGKRTMALTTLRNEVKHIFSEILTCLDLIYMPMTSKITGQFSTANVDDKLYDLYVQLCKETERSDSNVTIVKKTNSKKFASGVLRSIFNMFGYKIIRLPKRQRSSDGLQYTHYRICPITTCIRVSLYENMLKIDTKTLNEKIDKLFLNKM